VGSFLAYLIIGGKKPQGLKLKPDSRGAAEDAENVKKHDI